VQQLAAASSGAMSATAAWLRGDAAAASSQAAQNAAALRDYFGVQLGPLPLSFTVRRTEQTARCAKLLQSLVPLACTCSLTSDACIPHARLHST
jgi:hypothetical protein